MHETPRLFSCKNDVLKNVLNFQETVDKSIKLLTKRVFLFIQNDV